jgi:hypothetical protein
MGVLKLTGSKKAVQFITDEGAVYQTSAQFLKSFLYNDRNTPFVLLKRLPVGVPPNKFPISPVYGSENKPADTTGSVLSYAPKQGDSIDMMSVKAVAERQTKAGFVDKKVW